MTIQLHQIAALVGGQVIGDPETVIEGACPPWEAGPAEITMLDDAKRMESIADCEAAAIVASEVLEDGRAQVIVADPHAAFETIVGLFRPPLSRDVIGHGIDPTARIDPSAIVHPSATVGAGAVIGAEVMLMPGVVVMPQCRIGKHCIIHANVTLYEYTRIDDCVVIHAGSVIGANGFGYRLQSGRHLPTAQLGYVHIESDVEIGAGVTIDRGTYGATRIGEGTKIDNQVMIGHNCQIGRHNLLCSQVGIAGSCRTGDYVILAGQVGLKDHITLGDHTIVGAQAGVMDDCPGNEVYLGSPATTQREQMQIMAVERRLPEMRRELKQLRRQLDQLQADLASSDHQPPQQDRRAA